MSRPKPSLTQASSAKSQSYSPDAAAAKISASSKTQIQNDEEKKRLNVVLPASTYAQFQHAASEEGRSVSWIVRELIQRYVIDHGQGSDLVKRLREQED
jgi:hypothetical protein